MLKVTVASTEKPAEGESADPSYRVTFIDDKEAVAWVAIHDLKSIFKLNDALTEKCKLDETISKSFAAHKEAETIPTEKQTEEYLNSVLAHYSSKIWDNIDFSDFFGEGQEQSRPRKHKNRDKEHRLKLDDPEELKVDDLKIDTTIPTGDEFVDEENKKIPSYTDKLAAMGEKKLIRSDSFHSTDSMKIVSTIDGIPVCVTRTSSADDENQPVDPQLEPHYDTLEEVYQDERAAGWRMNEEKNDDDDEEDEEEVEEGQLTIANLEKLNKAQGGEMSFWSKIQNSFQQRELSDSPYSSECELDMYEVDLSVDLIYLLRQCGIEGYHAEEILYAITPKDLQIEYRNSVVNFMNRQIRDACNATGFNTGLHALNCNLPDDPIKMSVALCKKNLINWQVALSDMLNLQTERHATGRLQMHIKAEEANSPPGDKPYNVHLVTNTNSLLEVNGNYAVTCTIDSTIEVEVTATSCTSYALCMLVFIEEIALIVGQNNLFKRSILMIRAWWTYETNAKHMALSDHVMLIMITAIFNQFASVITTPLEALCIFLREYSNYDGATQLITLQGVVPFFASDTNRAQLICPAPNHLVTEKLLDRCLTVLNCHDQQIALRRAIKAQATLDQHYRQNMDGYFNPVEYVNHPNFQRKRFNVLDPFTLMNMMTQDKISRKASDRLTMTFRSGYQKMSGILTPLAHRAASSANFGQPLEDGELTTALKRFFVVTLSKFNEVYGPNISRNDLLRMSMLQPTVPYANPSQIWQSISYCKLIQEALITEASIITLITETLARKGPVPVSEIGKALTEVTSINNIAQQLKERFGGLKKLLQRCSSIFLFSNDHPFNPHVMLRSSVPPEQMRQLEDGLFPGRLLNLKTARNTSSPAGGKSTNRGASGANDDPYSSGSDVDSPRMSRKKYLENKKAELAGKPRSGSPLHQFGGISSGSGGGQEQQYKFTMPAGGANKTKPNPLLLSSLHNSLLKQNSGTINYASSPVNSSHGSNRSSPKLHQQLNSSINGSNSTSNQQPLYHVGGYMEDQGRAGSPHSFSGQPDYRSSPVGMMQSPHQQQPQQHFQSVHYRPNSNKNSPVAFNGFQNGGSTDANGSGKNNSFE